MPKVCYYCGRPATTREHAPPKQMFAAFACDRITVPSCDEHNTQKGGKDQAIVHAFLMSLENLRRSKENYKFLEYTQVIQAIEHAKEDFHFTKKLVSSKPILDGDHAFTDLPNLAYLSHAAEITQWMRQLTAALVFDANKQNNTNANWQEAMIISFDIWDLKDPITPHQILQQYEDSVEFRRYYDSLLWIRGWSSYPKYYPEQIYKFFVHFDDQCSMATFKHIFYSQYTWFVRFYITENAKIHLMQKVETYHGKVK